MRVISYNWLGSSIAYRLIFILRFTHISHQSILHLDLKVLF
jgi:hypothetical protein